MKKSAKSREPETMPPGWEAAAAEMLAVYRAAGLNPPSPDNFQAHFPRHVRVLPILDLLAKRGDLIRLGDGLYVPPEAVEGVRETVRRLAAADAGGTVTVAAVRDATESSRRVVVPILERFDAEGFTRREGDMRMVDEAVSARHFRAGRNGGQG